MKIPNKVVKFWLFVEVVFGSQVRKIFQWEKSSNNSSTWQTDDTNAGRLPGIWNFIWKNKSQKASGRGKVLLIICSQKHDLSLRLFLSHHQSAIFLPLLNVLTFQEKLNPKILFIIETYSLEIIQDFILLSLYRVFQNRA